jgi:hypothetical protein
MRYARGVLRRQPSRMAINENLPAEALASDTGMATLSLQAGSAVYFAAGNLVYKRDTDGLLTRVAGLRVWAKSRTARIRLLS